MEDLVAIRTDDQQMFVIDIAFMGRDPHQACVLRWKGRLYEASGFLVDSRLSGRVAEVFLPKDDR